MMITRLETPSSGSGFASAATLRATPSVAHGVVEHVCQYVPDPITRARLQRFWQRRAVPAWRAARSPCTCCGRSLVNGRFPSRSSPMRWERAWRYRALVVGRFLKPASHCSAYCRTVYDAGRQGVLAERLGDRRCQPRDVMRCPGRPDAMAASSGSTPKTRHDEPRSRTFRRCP